MHGIGRPLALPEACGSDTREPKKSARLNAAARVIWMSDSVIENSDLAEERLALRVPALARRYRALLERRSPWDTAWESLAVEVILDL